MPRRKPLQFEGRHRVSLIIRLADLRPATATIVMNEIRSALVKAAVNAGEPISASGSWTDLDDLGTYALRLRRRRVL
jgi:hypothetical protein